jgi:alkanesulfonate monooxygenase SsuD/methylene tetrahydromethanopterin reductase-like flavin-dependent oxidoreductase (luciferase family)
LARGSSHWNHRAACAELAQRAERLGYSTVFVGEHLDTGYGPFAMASALASATSLLRVGTLMLLNDLRHPAILAKEAAPLDVLSGAAWSWASVLDGRIPITHR